MLVLQIAEGTAKETLIIELLIMHIPAVRVSTVCLLIGVMQIRHLCIIYYCLDLAVERSNDIIV